MGRNRTTSHSPGGALPRVFGVLRLSTLPDGPLDAEDRSDPFVADGGRADLVGLVCLAAAASCDLNLPTCGHSSIGRENPSPGHR